MSTKVVKFAYAAVRRTADSGKEWLDLSSLNVLASECRKGAYITDTWMPDWATVNPVVRFVEVKVSEEHTLPS